MSVRIKGVAPFGALTVAVFLSGCGSKLPKETEKVDLAQAGLAVALEAPRGGQARKDGARALIEWGPHGEAGTLSLGKREVDLKCNGQDEDCKLVEPTPNSVIKETTFMKRAHVDGLANIATGGTTLGCKVSAKDVDDVRRLLAACRSVSAAAPLIDTTSLTSASAAAAAPSAAPPSLEAVTASAKDSKGPFSFSIRVPVGHSVLESGAARTFGSPRETPVASQLSVTVSPYASVTSLANAEKAARLLDITGLDRIADRRELSKTSFLVSTAPRGSGRMMTVSVYANGKKRSALAKCSGTEALRATLEEMCASLEVE
jgi:hypothetical protein